MAANPLVNLSWTGCRACVRMGNLDRRHQMANVNDLESTLLKVGNSFLVEVIGEEGGNGLARFVLLPTPGSRQLPQVPT
jgi:hypothetical protein